MVHATSKARWWWSAAAAVLLVVAAVMWLRDSDAIERTSLSESERDQSSSPAEAALANDGTARGDARARIDDPRLTPTKWRFDHVVFVLGAESRAPIAFDVQSYASDGTRRAARSDDVVLARDVEPGGVWILSAPGRCPTWIAPEMYVELNESERVEAAVALVPSATLVVLSSDGAPLPATIQWIEVTPVDESIALSHLPNGAVPAEMDFAVVNVGNAQRALFAGVDDVARAAQHVQRLRDELQKSIDARNPRDANAGSVRALEVSFAHDRDPWAYVMAFPPFGERVAFEHVPTTGLFAVRLGREPLIELECVGERSIASRQMFGIAHTDGFRLAPGERLEFTVRRSEGAIVRGRLPETAAGATRLELARVAATIAGMAVRNRVPLAEPTLPGDGTFEWAALIAGSYELTATWREPPDVHASAVLTFELAEGEVRDLGVLAPHPAGRVTLVPRLVGLGGAALPRGVDPNSLVMRAWLAPPVGSKLAGRELELTHGRAVVLAGLEAGSHRLTVSDVSVADHRTLIENSGGLSGVALIEALARDLDANRVALAPGCEPLAIEIDGSTRVDVDVPIVRPVVCRVTVEAAAGQSANGHFVARLVGDGGRVVLPLQRPAYQSSESGGFQATLEFDCPEGRWTLVVNDVPPTNVVKVVNGLRDESNTRLREQLVARIDIVVDASDVDATGRFERAATLRIVGAALRAALLTAPRLVEFENLSEPLTSGHSIDGALEFTGLFANSAYVFADGTVVHTGAPGSVTLVR